MDGLSHPFFLHLGSTRLVFGLEWFPLLGAQPRHQSLRLARKHGAGYFVLGGEHSGSVGLARLRIRREYRRTPLYSAAQNLATLFPHETVAVIAYVQEHGWWLAAVHQGAVVARTDRLYATRELAWAAVDDLRPAYPQLRCLDADTEPAAPTLIQLQDACTTRSSLQQSRRWHSRLPWPVRIFLMILVLVAGLPEIWGWLQHETPPNSDVISPDSTLMWQRAIMQSTQGHLLHGVKGTGAILEALHDQPVTVAGWRLVQTTCVTHASVWTCSGDYQRQDQQASNEGLLAILSPEREVRFPSMDLAQISWTLSASGIPLTWQSLKTAAETDRYLVSAWQGIRPAFNQMSLGKPMVWPVAVPRDQDGQALPRPAGLPLHMSRPVQINGPLRSFMLLVPYTATIEWQRVVLNLNDASQATLQNSQLRVSFEGVLHEIQTMPN